jgi:uncharacterized membrane protein YgcG
VVEPACSVCARCSTLSCVLTVCVQRWLLLPHCWLVCLRAGVRTARHPRRSVRSQAIPQRDLGACDVPLWFGHCVVAPLPLMRGLRFTASTVSRAHVAAYLTSLLATGAIVSQGPKFKNGRDVRYVEPVRETETPEVKVRPSSYRCSCLCACVCGRACCGRATAHWAAVCTHGTLQQAEPGGRRFSRRSSRRSIASASGSSVSGSGAGGGGGGGGATAPIEGSTPLLSRNGIVSPSRRVRPHDVHV